MRLTAAREPVRLACGLAAALLLALLAAVPADATPVLVLKGQRVVRHDDRFVAPGELPGVTAARQPPLRGSAHRPKGPRPTERALTALLAARQITPAQQDSTLAAYRAAESASRRLKGVRARELAAVVANVDGIATAGMLTPARLAPLSLTLERNTQWWTSTGPPAAGQDVAFAGSELVWQYYPGQGMELQQLATFGKANGLWSAHRDSQLSALLAEVVPLAASRDGVPTWEYYFSFDGGRPPWTSGMSQATAIEALGRASRRLRDTAYATLAHQALGLFELPPPAGVRVATAAGAHYLLYSFAPGVRVLNGFLQAIIGLYDYAHNLGDATATALYEAGDAEARVAVPRYDTGAWSLYDQTHEASASYHELVIGFLSRLCKDFGAAVYCDYATRFSSYLHTVPTLASLTTHARAGSPVRLRFTLDKISVVTVAVRRGSRIVYFAHATEAHGADYFLWRRGPRTGRYSLTISATDLAGNHAQAQSPLTVLARAPHSR